MAQQQLEASTLQTVQAAVTATTGRIRCKTAIPMVQVPFPVPALMDIANRILL